MTEQDRRFRRSEPSETHEDWTTNLVNDAADKGCAPPDARVDRKVCFAVANQARASCSDGSTMSWLIPVTRPTIVASAG
jgi:hypothetical protein